MNRRDFSLKKIPLLYSTKKANCSIHKKKEDSFVYSNTSKLFYDGYEVSRFFHEMDYARKVDKLLSNPKIPLTQLQEVFKGIFTNGSFLYWFSDNEKAAKQLKEFPLKNRSQIYRFRTTPEQLNAQWARLVEAHRNDTQLDVDFASLIAFNYDEYALKEKKSYMQRIFSWKENPRHYRCSSGSLPVAFQKTDSGAQR